MNSKMSEEEFEKELKKCGLTASEACISIENRTGVQIRASIIYLHIERYGAMSSAYTALFRLLFKELGRQHESA